MKGSRQTSRDEVRSYRGQAVKRPGRKSRIVKKPDRKEVMSFRDQVVMRSGRKEAWKGQVVKRPGAHRNEVRL